MSLVRLNSLLTIESFWPSLLPCFELILHYIQFTAPTVITFPSDPVNLTVAEGNQTTLTCTARGVPAPEFMWYRESELINGSDTRLQISSSEIVNTTTGFIYVTSKLNITVANRSDSGVFSCVAVNIVVGVLSSDSLTYNVTVNCKSLHSLTCLSKHHHTTLTLNIASFQFHLRLFH